MEKEVCLRPLQISDINGMLEWMQDEDTQQWFQSSMKGRKMEEVLDFIENAKSEPSDGESIRLAVTDKK